MIARRSPGARASIRTDIFMGTTVTIEVVRGDQSADEAIARAFEWFRHIEATCTRFDEHSEVMQLTRHVGVPVEASPVLYEAVQFALHVADDSGGAFDPTVGHRMASHGFNREHRTGSVADPGIAVDETATYRDVHIDPGTKTITLMRPLVLDLGAVAKGLAVDVAARELQPFEDFAIDAGGDLYLGGQNADGEPWSVGIRHPRVAGTTIGALSLSNAAVCTSGDYERTGHQGASHIVDPRGAGAAIAASSVTVVASSAMLADALGTAAFVLGPADGIRFLERHHVAGLIIDTDMTSHATSTWPHA